MGFCQPKFQKLNDRVLLQVSPDLTTCQQKNCLFPDINKMNSTCCTMTTIRIWSHFVFDAEKIKIDSRVFALKRLQKPRQKVHNNRRKAALCGVPGEDALYKSAYLEAVGGWQWLIHRKWGHRWRDYRESPLTRSSSPDEGLSWGIFSRQ